jgi:fibrillarin-like rRNA methylase
MDKQVVKNSLSDQQYTVDNDLLESIKNFMDDLSTITTHKNFQDYHTIVNRIDQTKVKSYVKLIKGFKAFFENNEEALNEGNFDGLNDPNISYVTDTSSFTFDFQKTFQEAAEGDQDVIKDHLNHIWTLLNDKPKSLEEIYIEKVFSDLRARVSQDMTREDQMMLVKDLFSDFQKQKLDMAITIKAACIKARELLEHNTSEDNSTMLMLIETVEEIDINNFDMMSFMGLIAKMSCLFSNTEDGNPLNSVLSSLLVNPNNISLDQLQLNLETKFVKEDKMEAVEDQNPVKQITD